MTQPSTADRIAHAVTALGEAALSEAAVAAHVRPLFARVLRESPSRAYLANHSLGRPLDAMAEDVQEGLAAWYTSMGGAWDAWHAEIEAYRARLARLLGSPRADAIIPKTSAGQGLRAVLNTYDRPLRVVATRGEFDSIDVILREYAARGRVALDSVPRERDGRLTAEAIQGAIRHDTDLVVISPVMFETGQCLPDLQRVIDAAHACGARVMLDVYHALGVLPLDIAALRADFAIGGSYKYLRGGPGAAFLYVAPEHLDSGLRTLDIGWFAKERPFEYARPDPPRYARGGDGWMESTPPVLPFYQARSGQVFTLAMGVARLRAYGLERQRILLRRLADEGVVAQGGDAAHGAFLTVRHPQARAWAAELGARNIVADARGEWLRLCPDVLTTEEELDRLARALGQLQRATR